MATYCTSGPTTDILMLPDPYLTLGWPVPTEPHRQMGHGLFRRIKLYFYRNRHMSVPLFKGCCFKSTVRTKYGTHFHLSYFYFIVWTKDVAISCFFLSPIAVNWLNVSFFINGWKSMRKCFVRLFWMTNVYFTVSMARGVTACLFYFHLNASVHKGQRSKLAYYILALYLCVWRHKQSAFPGPTVHPQYMQFKFFANIASLQLTFGKGFNSCSVRYARDEKTKLILPGYFRLLWCESSACNHATRDCGPFDKAASSPVFKCFEVYCNTCICCIN